MAYFYLAIAIIAEVIATTTLKASAEFSKVIPSSIVICGYACSFYFMSLSLRAIPIGIAYALWSGLGLVLVGIAAALIYKQIPDWPAIIGMLLIISGVLLIQLFSKTIH